MIGYEAGVLPIGLGYSLVESKSKIYERRGVSSLKEDVLAATAHISPGQFPGAFCKAITNPFGTIGEDSLFFSHADGCGSKSVMAYLYWRETGDLSGFRGLSQDAIVMNTDDLLCVGAVDHFYFSSTITRNKHRIPKEVLMTLLEGCEEFISLMHKWGIHAELMGGETADMGDAVKTLTVDMNAVTFIDKKKIIDTNKIKPGLTIIGLSAAGKTDYESIYNSGIAANGLTSARHDLLNSSYRERYPETYAETTPLEWVYTGNHRLQESLKGTSLTIGQALLSPTRTYLPVVRSMLQEYPEAIIAILHLTGGGQTKCLKFGTGIHYVKDQLFNLPPIFQLLAESHLYKKSPEEFFKVFNGGHRLEIYVEEKWVNPLIKVSERFGLPAQVIGYTESWSKISSNALTLTYGGQSYQYHS